MLVNAYAIFDIKADIYNTPFFMPRDGMALRAFLDLANDHQSTISKHPGDYKLVHIGTYDDATAELTAVHPLRSLGFAADLITKE